MVGLKQLIEDNKWDNVSDIQIIESFFILNDMEDEGMELLHRLTQLKISKIKREQQMAKDWFTYIPSKYLYETYDLETADKLHTLELDFLINGGKLSADLLNWARENIPKIIRPDAYFNPLVVYLKDKNIEFKVK